MVCFRHFCGACTGVNDCIKSMAHLDPKVSVESKKLLSRLEKSSPAAHPEFDAKYRFSADGQFFCDRLAFQCLANCDADGSEPTGDSDLDELHSTFELELRGSAKHTAAIGRYDARLAMSPKCASKRTLRRRQKRSLYFCAYGAARGGVPCAEPRAIVAPRPPGRPEPPGREVLPVSTPNGHRMATTAGPQHGGGTAGRVRVRTGNLAPCRRPVARVRSDHGPGYGRRPKRIANR
jgi:hypothetical protein